MMNGEQYGDKPSRSYLIQGKMFHQSLYKMILKIWEHFSQEVEKE